MDPKTQPVPGYYVWDVPGQSAIVYLSLDALDRLEAEILRGFGAVPKRGAEAGGVLLGSVERGAATNGRTVIRIRDFEPVGCSHKRGPSYWLDEQEARTFQETCEHWKPDPSRPVGAVGFYRGNTRDESGLDSEDLARIDRQFPQPEAIALLVRPFATRASVAGFFLRQGGTFPAASPLEFPFRRKDLTGPEPAPRQPSFERPPVESSHEPSLPESPRTERVRHYQTLGLNAPEVEAPAESASRFRSGWVWLPLSFVFLLLGVFLGFQLGLGMGPRGTASAASADLTLGLTVTRAEDNLSVRWNRDALAVQSAQKGLLEIEDGSYSKPVDLDQAHLRNGSIIYRHSSDTVRFRLIVYVNSRLTVTETLEWRQ
ncbi:MAG TPA: hypothetical protein VN841_17100 [Bryobacteraceae bacterium]|nr:hypothetical protein [Bryobacteraceae bacterium]